MLHALRSRSHFGETMADRIVRETLEARAVEGTEAENALCPYSGKPVTHLLETGGRRFGFCNTFCRDKTAADPEAWPVLMALVTGK